MNRKEAQEIIGHPEVTRWLTEAEKAEQQGEFEQAEHLYRRLPLDVPGVKDLMNKRLRRLGIARSALSVARNAEDARDYYEADASFRIISRLYSDAPLAFAEAEQRRLRPFWSYPQGGVIRSFWISFENTRALRKMKRMGAQLLLRHKLAIWGWRILIWGWIIFFICIFYLIYLGVLK